MAEGGVIPKSVPRPDHVQKPTISKSILMGGTGGHRVMEIETNPAILPKPGEILIEVEACGIGFNDILMRQGFLGDLPKFPFIMGSECSGIVSGMGTPDSGFQVGDHVIAVPEFGAWGEVISVPAKYVFHVPEFLKPYYNECSALFVNYVAAYIMLFDVANLKPGSSVFINAAVGGMGLALIALCRTVEDITIFGTASAAKHCVLEERVDHVFDCKEDYVTKIKEIAPDGVDLVLESRGGVDFEKALALLRPLGKCISYGCSNLVTGSKKPIFNRGDSDTVAVQNLRINNKSVMGFSLRGMMYRQNDLDRVREAYEKVCRLMHERNIVPPIDSILAFEDVDAAMSRMENRMNLGRIALNPKCDPLPREGGRRFGRIIGAIESFLSRRGQAPAVENTPAERSPGDLAPEAASDAAQSQQASAESTARPVTPAPAPETTEPKPGESTPAEQSASASAKTKREVKFAEPPESESKLEEAKPMETLEPESQSSVVNGDQHETKSEPAQAEPVENKKGENESQPNPEEKLKETEGQAAFNDTPEEQTSEEGAFEESHE